MTSVPDPITDQPLRPDPGTGGALSFTISLPQACENLLGPELPGSHPAAIRLSVQNLS